MEPARAPSLRSLSLTRLSLTAWGASHLTHFARLTALHLSFTLVDDDAIVHIASECSSILCKYMYDSNTRFLSFMLAELTGLVELKLTRSRVSNLGLGIIGNGTLSRRMDP